MNKRSLITTSVCIVLGISIVPQKSQAIEIVPLFDEILKRGVCALFQSNVGQCAQNTDTSQLPTSLPTPNSPSPTTPENIPTDTNIPQASETLPIDLNFNNEYPQKKRWIRNMRIQQELRAK